MNSLVGYGVSSDSDSEGDGDDGNNKKAECDSGTAMKKSRNFLLESGSASSSESDPEEDQPPPPPRCTAPVVAPPPSSSQSQPRTPLLPAPVSSLLTHKLPPPHLAASSGSSVFANPFKAHADQKLSVLQKHVPLTLQARPSQIGGKRMCVSYRKDGRCRFGIKCKFAHDSDLQSSVLPGDYDSPAPGPPDGPGSDQVDHHNAGGSYGGRRNFGGEKEEEGEEGQQGKKRRVGLSNTLVPPKRAMKQYARQRNREQVHLT